MNLSIKHRPKTFSEIVGHPTTVKDLQGRLKKGEIPQTSFFLGITGTGKSTLGYVLAKALVCQNLKNQEPCNECCECANVNEERFTQSVRLYNASNIGIDEARNIEEDTNTYDISSVSGKKVFILDEIQEMVSNQKALKNFLKMLETERDGVYFILLAMSDFKIPVAVKNRAVTYKLQPVPFGDIARYLKTVCEAEEIEVTAERVQSLMTVAQNADGSIRTALSYLDRVISSELWDSEQLIKELGIVSQADLKDITLALLKKDVTVMRYEISEDTLKRLRMYISVYAKGLAGYKIPDWQKPQYVGLPKAYVKEVVHILQQLNESLKYSYLDQTTVDSIILGCVV